MRRITVASALLLGLLPSFSKMLFSACTSLMAFLPLTSFLFKFLMANMAPVVLKRAPATTP